MHVLTSTEVYLPNGESGKYPLENINIERYFYIHYQIHTFYMPTYTDSLCLIKRHVMRMYEGVNV
jgi:hypothetical protein